MMMTSSQTAWPAARRRGRDVALGVLQGLLALTFLLQGGAKLTGAAVAVAVFDEIGAGDWLRYVIGALELAGAVALLVPRLSGVAALAFAGLMLGAVATHLVVLGDSPALPAVLLVLTAVLAWARRDRTTALLRRLRGEPA
jgi:putative oxidoreductase